MSSYVVGAAAVGWFSAAMRWLAMLLELYELELLERELEPVHIEFPPVLGIQKDNSCPITRTCSTHSLLTSGICLLSNSSRRCSTLLSSSPLSFKIMGSPCKCYNKSTQRKFSLFRTTNRFKRILSIWRKIKTGRRLFDNLQIIDGGDGVVAIV
ncbi:hypothetical protein ACFX2F_038955 [Malus domestica]